MNIKRLQIWQQNLNTSFTAQSSLLSNNKMANWDIIAIQEPYINFLHNTHANHHWYIIYPTQRFSHPQQWTRAIMLINTKLNTNTWKQIPFPSLDVIAIQL
ncbi:hypothetical protein BDR06DRAFT_874921 [Suillus hirtellus]|nr:hypothetical protein BDR06DRAFT_874921 [Suillus hirtellus]